MREVEVVRRIYDTLADDGPAVFELLDPGIRWVTPATLPWTVPGSGGHYVGHDELATYFAYCLDEVADLEVVVNELLPADGRVLMVGAERGRSRRTGNGFDARCAHLWTVRGGLGLRLDGFIDTATVASAFE